jgi:N6-adenosine-specific RNA methylase IME4
MKRYKTIYADPPWQYDDKLDDSRKKPYKTLGVDDIMCLNVKKVSEGESHLYLWVTSSFLHAGLEIMKVWGFTYKCHIVWLKRTKHGKIGFGMGHYFRHCNELLLFGTRGNLKIKTRNTRNFIEAKKPGNHHSAKPIEMYELIEANSYPDYLELFATNTRKGWDSIGFEIDGKDIRDYL